MKEIVLKFQVQDNQAKEVEGALSKDAHILGQSLSAGGIRGDFAYYISVDGVEKAFVRFQKGEPSAPKADSARAVRHRHGVCGKSN